MATGSVSKQIVVSVVAAVLAAIILGAIGLGSLSSGSGGDGGGGNGSGGGVQINYASICSTPFGSCQLVETLVVGEPCVCVDSFGNYSDGVAG